jgi:diaminopimelate epimerase
MKYEYSIYRPSGNDTALVHGLVNDISLKKQINDSIQKKHSNVEQVGFVGKIGDEYYLEMAGGEFCGNATRSAIHYFKNGKPGEMSIHVSGVSKVLNGGIYPDGKVWVNMPIMSSIEKVLQKGNFAVVEMEGITHIIVPRESNEYDPDKLKSEALVILKSLNLTENVAASGVMFTTKTEKGYKIDPVVWVKNLKTLYYETACGSGTTAVGLYESKRKDSSLDIDITQPSGMDITISVTKGDSKFVSASIVGTVQLIDKDFEIEL